MIDRQQNRNDLAATLTRLVRALVAAEQPILAAHDLSMWGYVVLNELDRRPLSSQTVLAHEIGADKTRIIGTLDRLQHAGLITRDPDPADRRARLLTITPRGAALRETVQTEIQANEDRVLSALSDTERRAFLRAATKLAALPKEEFRSDQRR